MKVTIDVNPLEYSMMERLGCGSHACAFNRPKGMGTNSGKCYCLGGLSDYEQTRFAQTLGKLYHAAKELKDETETTS